MKLFTSAIIILLGVTAQMAGPIRSVVEATDSKSQPSTTNPSTQTASISLTKNQTSLNTIDSTITDDFNQSFQHNFLIDFKSNNEV